MEAVILNPGLQGFLYHRNVSSGNPSARFAVLNQNTSSEHSSEVAKLDTLRAAIQENGKPGDYQFYSCDEKISAPLETQGKQARWDVGIKLPTLEV